MYNETYLTVCYCIIYRTIGFLTSSNILIACLLKLQKLNYMPAHYRIYYLETLFWCRTTLFGRKLNARLIKWVTYSNTDT